MDRKALFSVQVSLDGVVFSPHKALVESTEYLLAFQLLSYDIVVFEDPLASPSVGIWKLASGPRGQSCLFESDANELRCAIQADVNAALVLLVLEREDQRAKLVAFAGIALELPPSITTRDTSKRPRVSEWSSVDGEWILRDHDNVEVGRINGSVTLACLGHTLMSHLTAHSLIGIQQAPLVEVSEGSNTNATKDENAPNGEDKDSVHEEAPEATTDSESPAQEPSPKKPSPKDEMSTRSQLREIGVQCVDNEEDAMPLKSIMIRGGRHNQRTTPRSDELSHPPRRGEHSLSYTRHHGHTDTSPSYPMPSKRFIASEKPVKTLVEADLPPPLFFSKPKK